jgi:hypothetical protein
VAGVGGEPPGTALTPVGRRGRGPSAWVVVGLVTVVLVALIGISLVGRSGAGPGSQAAATGPTATATAAAGDSVAATSVATAFPTAPPTPSPGTPPPRVAVAVGPVPTCPPGSTPDTPGPSDSGPADNRPTIAFDRHAGKLVALVGTVAGPVETWTFDVCTNTWTLMHPDREPPPGTGQLVYDVDSDVTIASDGVWMWAYDLGANIWTEKGPFAPFAHARFPGLRFYDPVSGFVVALGDDGDDDTLGLELWSYEVETDTWTPIRQADPLTIGPHYEFFAYDASVDRLVAYSRAWTAWRPGADGEWPFEARTWLFDLRTGTWSGTGAVTPSEFSAGMWGWGPGIAYDEAAERTVMLGQGHSAAYDAIGDRWETLYEGSASEDQLAACGTRPECRHMPQLVYDPVNERLVVFGGFVPTAAGEAWPDGMSAFDTRTREWTVLLEASGGRATPP